jgi:DNA-binding transcriptional ArsR family regulator
MVKTHAHRPDRQRNKTAGDAHYEIVLTAESVLPPKKPPMPVSSVERREGAQISKSPKSLLEQLTFGKRARRVVADLIIELVETCRDDFMPGTPLCEFFMYVLIGGKMLSLHERGREASASDLSRLTGIPRTTVQRKLRELSQAGAIERRGHRWIITPSFFNTPLVLKGFKRRQVIVSLAREKIATTGN